MRKGRDAVTFHPDEQARGLAFREWWADKGRLIDAPGAMAQRIMFAEKVWHAASIQAETKARQQALEEAELTFKAAYSEYDEPLIGVMWGLKAIASLRQVAGEGAKP